LALASLTRGGRSVSRQNPLETKTCFSSVVAKRIHYLMRKLEECRLLQPLAHAGSSLADFSTLKMEAIQSSETSVQSTTSTRRHTPEDGILHSHRRENLKSYRKLEV
jgi:hypothetical protein